MYNMIKFNFRSRIKSSRLHNPAPLPFLRCDPKRQRICIASAADLTTTSHSHKVNYTCHNDKSLQELVAARLLTSEVKNSQYQ